MGRIIFRRNDYFNIALVVAIIVFTGHLHHDAPLLYAAQEVKTGQNSSGSASALYDEAMSHFNAQKYRLAWEKFDRMLRLGNYDAAQKEAIERRMADCLYFLGREGIADVRIRAAGLLKDILTNYAANSQENIIVYYKLARTYEDMNFDYEALQNYEKFGKLNSDHIYEQEVRYKIGLLLNRVKRYRQAAEALGEFLKKYPKGPYSNLAMFIIGDSFLQLNQELLARVWFTEARKFTADFSVLPKEILFMNGAYEFKLRRYKEAIGFLMPLINTFPQDNLTQKALELLADSYAGLGVNDRALKLYGLLLDRTRDPKVISSVILKIANIGVVAPNIEVPRVLSGMDYYIDPARAYDKLFDEATSMEFRDEILIRKSAAMFLKGNIAEALDMYLKMLREQKMSQRREEIMKLARETAKRLSDDFHNRGQHLELVDLYLKLEGQGLKFNDDLDFMLRVANSMARLGLYRQAESIYREMLLKHQDRAIRSGIWISLVKINLNEGRYGQAESNLNHLLGEIKARGKIIDNDIMMLMAAVYLKSGDPDKALLIYGKAYAAGFDLPAEDLMGYALALQKSNNLQSAAAIYEKAISKLKAIKPRPELLPLAYSQLADVLFLSKKYQDAIGAYQNALTAKLSFADASWATFQIGNSYRRLKKYSKAEETFKNLKDQTGNDALWGKMADLSLVEARKYLTAGGGEGGRP